MVQHTGIADSASSSLVVGSFTGPATMSTAMTTTRSDVSAVGVRFYIPSGAVTASTGYTGYLMDSTTNGNLPDRTLQTIAFGTVSTNVWMTATFPSSTLLTAGKIYWFAVFYPNAIPDQLARFVTAQNFWDTSGCTLIADGNASAPFNGSYNFSATNPTFPNAGNGGIWLGMDPIIDAPDQATTAFPAIRTFGFTPGGTLGGDKSGPFDWWHPQDYALAPVPPPTAMATWANAVANINTTPARVLIGGNSIGEGQGASTKAKRWQDLLAASLRTMFPTNSNLGGSVGGDGFIPAQYAVYGTDSNTWGRANEATMTGTWSGQTGLGLGGRGIRMTAASTATWTVTGDNAEIWWKAGGGSFSWKVDGGGATTINTSGVGGTSQANMTPISLGAPGSHTIVLTWVSGTCDIEGICVWNTDRDQGIHFYDAARTGAVTNNFIGTPMVNELFPFVAPDLFITELVGANNYLNGTTTAAVAAADVQTQLNQLDGMAKKPSVVIIIPFGWAATNPNSLGQTWAQFDTAMLGLTYSQGITFLDLYQLWGLATAGGKWASDAIHNSDLGHSMIRDLLMPLVTYNYLAAPGLRFSAEKAVVSETTPGRLLASGATAESVTITSNRLKQNLGVPGIVNQSVGTNVSATGGTCAFTTTTLGNGILFTITRTGGLATGALTAVTDDAAGGSNVYTRLDRGAVSGGTNTRIETWYSPNAKAASLITYTSGTAQAGGFEVLEISNLDLVGVIDDSSPDNSGTASLTTIATPPVSAQPGDFVYAAAHFGTTTGATLLTGGWTALTDFDDAAGIGRAAYIIAPGGTASASWGTLAVAKQAGVITLAFRPVLLSVTNSIKVGIAATAEKVTPNEIEVGVKSGESYSHSVADSVTGSEATAKVKIGVATTTDKIIPRVQISGLKLGISTTRVGVISTDQPLKVKIGLAATLEKFSALEALLTNKIGLAATAEKAALNEIEVGNKAGEIYSHSVADSVTGSDATVKAKIAVATVSEKIGPSELAPETKLGVAATAEKVAPSELTPKVKVGLGAAVEGMVASERVVTGTTVHTAATREPATASETTAAKKIASATTREQGSLNDRPVKITVETYSHSVTDSLSVSEQSAGTKTSTGTARVQALGTDRPAGAKAVSNTVSDQLVGNELVATKKIIGSPTIDSVVGSDRVVVKKITAAALTELALVDALSAMRKIGAGGTRSVGHAWTRGPVGRDITVKVLLGKRDKYAILGPQNRPSATLAPRGTAARLREKP